ncbi:MAG TPA: hemolysin III family protein [Gemmatimonadales bacterium]|nr:hemolysin III family protein [Gemmatimonadales bacterium]
MVEQPAILEGPLAQHRSQTPGEQIANSVSHGLGALGALVALPFLVLAASRHGTAAIAGALVFGTTLALLYLCSTFYHALAHTRAQRVLRIFDHSSIYLLIAGTYTPFTLGVLRGPWGWTLFGLIWALALTGVLVKASGRFKYPRLSTALYLAMGWLIVAAALPLWRAMPAWGLFWLAAGGLAYTGGVVFYAAKRMRYGHFVWHLFVMTGSACHLVAVLKYAV